MKPIYNEKHEEKLFIMDSPLLREMQQQRWMNQQRSQQYQWREDELNTWIYNGRER